MKKFLISMTPGTLLIYVCVSLGGVSNASTADFWEPFCRTVTVENRITASHLIFKGCNGEDVIVEKPEYESEPVVRTIKAQAHLFYGGLSLTIRADETDIPFRNHTWIFPWHYNFQQVTCHSEDGTYFACSWKQ